MKNLLIVIFFTSIFSNVFAQSDSLSEKGVATYKNNVQLNLLGFAGYFGLQYERALSKHVSISLIGDYFFPFARLTSDPTPSNFYKKNYFIHAQARYYFTKKSTFNNGFYLAGDVGYKYSKEYNVKDNDIYVENRAPIVGGGLGYQLLIKKRFVVDAGFTTAFSIWQQINSSSNNYGWVKSKSRTLDIPLYINIGYAV